MKRDIAIGILYIVCTLMFVVQDYSLLSNGATVKEAKTFILLTVFFAIVTVVYFWRYFIKRDDKEDK